jgi:hypothetical protein
LARPLVLPGDEGAWADGKRRELTDILRRALSCLAEACLRSGDTATTTKWAEEMIALDPYRETGYRHLMAAHTVAGNRAEALRVYEQCRLLLYEELGAYPSPETESLYRKLLEAPAAQVEELAAASDPPPRAAISVSDAEHGSKSRAAALVSRKTVAVVALTVAVAAAAVGGVVAAGSGGESQATAVAANSIVALDSSGSIAATVPVGARPVAIASGSGSLWVANLDDQSVTKVDVASRGAVRAIPIVGAPTGLAATRTAVWVTDGPGAVSKIDPRYDRLTSTWPLAASVGYFGRPGRRPRSASTPGTTSSRSLTRSSTSTRHSNRPAPPGNGRYSCPHRSSCHIQGS